MAEIIAINDGDRLSVIDNFIESNIIEITSGFPGPAGKDGPPGPPGARGPRGRAAPPSKPNEIVKLSGATTDSNTYFLNTDSNTALYIPQKSISSFYAAVSAYNVTDDLAAAFNIQGAVKRNSSGVMSSWINSGLIFSDSGMNSLVVAINTDSNTGTIVFAVNGINSKNIIWTGTVFINKI